MWYYEEHTTAEAFPSASRPELKTNHQAKDIKQARIPRWFPCALLLRPENRGIISAGSMRRESGCLRNIRDEILSAHRDKERSNAAQDSEKYPHGNNALVSPGWTERIYSTDLQAA